jgi:hypothetical protein
MLEMKISLFESLAQYLDSFIKSLKHLLLNTMFLNQINTNSQLNKEMIRINELPNELLVIIFDYLDIKSKLRSESVCKCWQQLIRISFDLKTTLLIEDIHSKDHKRYGDYKPFNIRNSRQLSVVCLTPFKKQMNKTSNYRFIISKIVSKFLNLKVLYLCFINCPLKRNVLKLVYESCATDLTQLSIICDDKQIIIKREEVLKLCQKFPNLKVFQMEAFYLLIREESIALMLNKWQNLEVFILMSLLSNSVRRVEVENYKGFCFKRMSPKLKFIEMPGFLLNERAIQLIADKQLKQLTHLNIFDLDAIKSIAIIGKHFHLISSLYCSSFGELETESEANLFFQNISRLKRLEKLHLLIDSETPIVGFNGIKHLKNCHNLKTLRIESTPLSVDSIEAIAKFLPKLLKLELTYVRLESNSDVCISHIQDLKHLENLKLSINPELTDSSVIKIIDSCHQLNYIDVSRSELISKETLLACIQFAHKNPNRIVKVFFESRVKDQIEKMNKIIPQNLILKYLYIRKI